MSTLTRGTLAVARTTLLEAVRNRILYGLLLFAVGMILLSAVLSNLTLGHPVRIVTDVSLSAVSLSGTLIAILLGVNAVAGEVQRRTLFPVLAKPVSRGEYVLGKYLGVFATVSINMAVMMVASTAMIAAYTAEKSFEYPVGAFAATLALSLLRAGLVAAISLALSTIASSTVAFIGALGLTLAGYFTDGLRFFLGKSESSVTRAVGEAVYYFVPDFVTLDPLAKLVHGEPVLTPQLAAAAGYGVLYCAVALIAAVLAFSRRDLA